MPETHSSTASFSEFGAKPMSDQQFVEAIDATMAPGLKLMNTTCLTASRDRKEGTHGRIPFTGHWPYSLRRLWHVGPMARSVGDIATAYQMRGADGHDGNAGFAPDTVVPALTEAGRPQRVGVIIDAFGPVDADVAAAVRDAGAALSQFGLTYERVRTFKFTVSAILGPLQEAITGATHLTPEQTGDLVIATIALTAPLWQAAHPAETLTRLYAEEPTLAHIGIDFAPTLTRLLTALCDGMTTADK